MAKLANMFIILIAIQAVLILVYGSTPNDSSLWTFVTNPSNWGSSEWIMTFIGIAGTMGVVGLVAGSVFGFKTDFLVLSAVVGGFLSVGVVFTNLTSAIGSDLANLFKCSGDISWISCAPATWIIAITVGPLAFYYVWTVIEWWRGKDV